DAEAELEGQDDEVAWRWPSERANTLHAARRSWPSESAKTLSKDLDFQEKAEEMIQRVQGVRHQRSLRHEQHLLAGCIEEVKEAEDDLAALEARQREGRAVAKEAVDAAIRRQNKQLEAVKKALASIASLATDAEAGLEGQDDEVAWRWPSERAKTLHAARRSWPSESAKTLSKDLDFQEKRINGQDYWENVKNVPHNEEVHKLASFRPHKGGNQNPRHTHNVPRRKVASRANKDAEAGLEGQDDEVAWRWPSERANTLHAARRSWPSECAKTLSKDLDFQEKAEEMIQRVQGREGRAVAKEAVDAAIRRQNKQLEAVKKALASIASLATVNLRAARRRPQDEAAAAPT
ncbi:hypothetical protein HPB47_018924, partial [Ixodes persulcatus]